MWSLNVRYISHEPILDASTVFIGLHTTAFKKVRSAVVEVFHTYSQLTEWLQYLFRKVARHSKQDSQCTYNVTLRRVRVTIPTVEKAKSIKYYKPVFTLALVIQHANRIYYSPYYTAICGLFGCTIFLRVIS